MLLQQAAETISTGAAIQAVALGCHLLHLAPRISTSFVKPASQLQVVLSHTPFRELAQKFGESPVLIAGRGATPQVAASYGFRKAVTTSQLEQQYPHALPFKGAVANLD